MTLLESTMMDPHEFIVERKYWYEERLGMLCGAGEPTPEQIQIAKDVAEHHDFQMRSDHYVRANRPG